MICRISTGPLITMKEKITNNYSQNLDLENMNNNDDNDDNEVNDAGTTDELVFATSNEEKLTDAQEEARQPFCPITLKCTREIAGFNGLSEAFKRLDFRNAVRDIRRFNYICKLLHLLITQNLTMLSGCAQRVLFTMLEEVAFQVSNNQTNIHILQKLLGDLQKTLIEYYCWGRPLGSTQLWEHHKQTIHRINCIAKCIVIEQPADSIYPKLQDLPEELVREIMLRLTDHTDLQNGGKAYTVMEQLLGEQHIWRELCRFHFTPQQIRHVLSSQRRASATGRMSPTTVAINNARLGLGPFIPSPQNELDQHQHGVGDEDYDGSGLDDVQNLPTNDNAMFKLECIDWQDTYHRLRRLFGLREEYAEILQFCRHCRCLFWKSFGHPCLEGTAAVTDTEASPDKSTLYVPITPQAFLKFFSL